MPCPNGGEQLYDRKNNPDINRGDGETLDGYLSRISEHISKLEWQSEGHRMWYTHKNPYSCWICELLQVGRALEAECLAFGQRKHKSSGTRRKTDIAKST